MQPDLLDKKIILQNWSRGEQPNKEEIEQLIAEELADFSRANVFDITLANAKQQIEERAQLFLTVCSDILKLCNDFGFHSSDYILINLWQLWLPLAMQLATAKKKLGRTLIQGILGGQGTGKTTLAAVIRCILDRLGCFSVAISIDDLYKTYAERQQLQQQDPRLIWRGPPGTHDVDLAITILDQFRQEDRQEPILVPRFDKSAFNGAGDRAELEKTYPVDIVIFEGWFVGTRPIEEAAFDSAPPPIITPEDKLFAKDTNARLKEYLPLWERLDRLIVLYPVDYRLSKQWRKEAEQRMIASGKSGMSETEIDRFVEYFWRALHPELFIQPLVNNPDLVDMAIEIKPDHSYGRVYRPGNLS
ncbi:glycerate kinase [Pleurocapsales cyanobacterium LEGE 06147]|nr:glycerate kinase [Pleurocapsales cyanobacterium LEGE 06147]